MDNVRPVSQGKTANIVEQASNKQDRSMTDYAWNASKIIRETGYIIAHCHTYCYSSLNRLSVGHKFQTS